MQSVLDANLDSASADAAVLFSSDLTIPLLNELGERHQLNKANGNKDEVIESLRVQYVNRKLVETRQKFMKTKGKTKQLKSYLPWYRVLLASYRRLHYAVLGDYAKE